MTPIERLAQWWVDRREYQRTHCINPLCDKSSERSQYCSEECGWDDQATRA